ncbi:hypothetical protein P7K49_020331 [Saguinus oedipus]|uniref:Uncharacterized protein n=1 Tax=Saguinus oedipus TaxID=9490 RepID=A0ABQ9UZX7_SAGOE|nr:hypothetical protein P7K49_020331 [Saguinus oedipus]
MVLVIASNFEELNISETWKCSQLSEPELMEVTGLIRCPGEHAAVTTFALGTKPWDDPSFPCLRPEATGHKVDQQAGQGILGPGVKPQPAADQLAEPLSGGPAAQPGHWPSLPSPAAPREQELAGQHSLHLPSSLAPQPHSLWKACGLTLDCWAHDCGQRASSIPPGATPSHLPPCLEFSRLSSPLHCLQLPLLTPCPQYLLSFLLSRALLAVGTMPPNQILSPKTLLHLP